MTKFSLKPINPEQRRILIALVVLVVVMLIFIVYRITQTSVQNQPSTTDQFATGQPYIGTLIGFDDPLTLTIGTKKLTFPTGWTINTAYLNNSDSVAKCSSASSNDCRIYEVTNGTETFYISTPTAIKDLNAPAITAETKALTFGGSAVDFRFEKLNLVKSSADQTGGSEPLTDLAIYYQAYGCSATGYCANTLVLSNDAAANATQIQDFEAFVQAITVQ